MFIACWAQPFANKISNVTQDDKDKVADICGEKNVIWRVLFHMQTKEGTLLMLAGRPVLLVSTVTKLCVNGGEDLFRRGWA